MICSSRLRLLTLWAVLILACNVRTDGLATPAPEVSEVETAPSLPYGTEAAAEHTPAIHDTVSPVATLAALTVQPVPGVTPVDATTIERKILWGYQGWFLCERDVLPWKSWGNWFTDAPASADSAAFDMWPDIGELDADELCPTPLSLPDGRTASLYSALNPKTIVRHFKWMYEYGIDGVFLQRFAVSIITADGRNVRDRVTQNVQAGAETYGRVFANMYDVTGLGIGESYEVLSQDWMHLVDDLKITDSPRYQRHGGKPVVALWGFPNAFDAAAKPVAVQDALMLIGFFQDNPNPKYQATVMCGVPMNSWRSDDPDWRPVLDRCDIVSPWTVGAYLGQDGADSYKGIILHDLQQARAQSIDYLPVVWPGSSTYHQDRLAGATDAAPNRFPRECGRFFWRQVYNAVSAGATMIYGAMFDEFNEGTQIIKTAPTAADMPAGGNFVALDADGCALPSDYYLRLAGAAAKMLRGEIPLSVGVPIAP